MTATQSTSSTAVNSTGLNLNSVAYLAQFTSSDTYQDWTGNLNAWPIDPTTGAVPTTGAPKWTAQAQLDAQSWDTGRLIATWDPVAKAGTPFLWPIRMADPDGKWNIWHQSAWQIAENYKERGIYDKDAERRVDNGQQAGRRRERRLRTRREGKPRLAGQGQG